MTEQPSTIKTIFMTMRPPFLVLTLSIMLLLLAVSVQQSGLQILHFSFSLFALVVIGALAAHIGVNMLNEYEDYQSGLDKITDKTPFSGGSGALPDNENAQEWVAAIAYGLIGIIISLGVYFIYLRGWGLLPIGLLGVFVILSYTSFLTRYPLACLIASGLGFGPLMMLGGYYVMFGVFSWQVGLVSLIPFLLVNNLLLINQLPDKQADAQIGRFNIWHKYGTEFGLKLFVLQGVLSFILLAVFILTGLLPRETGLALLLLLLFVALLLKVKYLLHTAKLQGQNEAFNQTAEWKDALNSVMAMNVGITIFLPIVIALGVYISLI